MVFEGTTECMNVSVSCQFQISKKEREICEFEMNLNNSFCLRSNLCNDNIVSA